jgi:hypothetical protein
MAMKQLMVGLLSARLAGGDPREANNRVGTADGRRRGGVGRSGADLVSRARAFRPDARTTQGSTSSVE